jgi:hypothetical protein
MQAIAWKSIRQVAVASAENLKLFSLNFEGARPNAACRAGSYAMFMDRSDLRLMICKKTSKISKEYLNCHCFP